jgi:hypothetical protein
MIPEKTLSAAETAMIVSRASHLAERLSGKFIPAEADESSAGWRLARWQEAAAQGKA